MHAIKGILDKRMKKIVTIFALLGTLLSAEAQNTLSLDNCRAMALRNNKQINVSRLKKDVAYNLRKSARTQYLPKVDAMGGYEWFSREISLLNKGQKSTLSNIGTDLSSGYSNVMLIHDGKPTRVGFKMDGDKKVRFAKSTGKVID